MVIKKDKHFFKPSGSETTKSELCEFIKPEQKGVPFEINQDEPDSPTESKGFSMIPERN